MMLTSLEVEAAFSKYAEEARSVGQTVKENKTKHLLSSTANNSSIGDSIELDGYKLEVVKDFAYIGSSRNTDSEISLEITRRLSLANRCHFRLRKPLSKRALSWITKICLYKSIILPVLLYGAETWMLTSSDKQALVVFERKILRKIYGPFCDRGEWRIRWNQEQYDIYDDIDVVKR